MPHTITLSDKARAFVDSRRGQTPADSYVCMLIENLADLSREYHAGLDDARIIDLIEAYAPAIPAFGVESSMVDPARQKEIARYTIDYLREAYNDMVPQSVFEKKCAERGLSPEEIREAVSEYALWLI